MKKFLVMALFVTGCSSISQKATNYCDSNWQGRYSSWQACYDRQYSAHAARGQVFSHMGDGLINAQRNSVNCTTEFNQIICR